MVTFLYFSVTSNDCVRDSLLSTFLKIFCINHNSPHRWKIPDKQNLSCIHICSCTHLHIQKERKNDRKKCRKKILNIFHKISLTNDSQNTNQPF